MKSGISYTTLELEKVVKEAVFNVSEELGISENVLAKILDVNTQKMSEMKNGNDTLEAKSEPFKSAVLLIRVFKSLSAITGGESSVGQSWMKSYNTALEMRPVECIYTKSGLENVVNYLDSGTVNI